MDRNTYFIIITILIIALIWFVLKKRKTEIENFEDIIDDVAERDAKKARLTELLGLLLDNQGSANQIIIDHNLTSVRELSEKNKQKIDLNLRPILLNDQFRVITRYLLLNDIYFTKEKNENESQGKGVEQSGTKIISFSRQEKFVKPSEIYQNINDEHQELLNFRINYLLEKNIYTDYEWISTKINKYIADYGLDMLKKSRDNMLEIFGNNYWEGMRYLSKANLRDLPIGTGLYCKDTDEFFYKIQEDGWYKSNIEIDQNINLLLKLITDPIANNKYWQDVDKVAKSVEDPFKSSEIESGDFFWIRSSSTFDLTRLYRKIDELSQNNYFSFNPTYDKVIQLKEGLEQVYTQIERMNLLKKWVENVSDDTLEQKKLLENIIIDLNSRIINIFDDICTYLIFYQTDDFSDLYLDKYLKLDKTLNNWWSAQNFNNVLVNGSKLGQCFLPALFSISKIQETPPIYKFVYNRNLYHTYWEPIETYLNDTEKLLNKQFKTNRIEVLAPIARFCAFNNPSIRNYLAKYIACNADSCPTNLTSLKEPQRCGALKLKYQELVNIKMGYKCFFRSKTDENPVEKKTRDAILQNGNTDLTPEEEEKQVNQLMGLQKLILLNLIEYAIKFHGCQTESVEIKNCQSMTDKIATEDQKDDYNLGVVDVDRKTDLFNIYDQQIDNYNKILLEQEIKKLEPLNILSNLKEKENKQENIRNFNIFNKSATDFYDIINDLTNIKQYTSDNESKIEAFDNTLRENLDLSDINFQDYKNRLEKEIRGFTGEKAVDYITKFKNIFYQIVDILTKNGRIMTSGFIIIVVSLSLYFIDITS
jgi:hypothetical protein